MNKKTVLVGFLVLIVLSFGTMACSKTKTEQASSISNQGAQQPTAGESLSQNNQSSAKQDDIQAKEEMLFTSINIDAVRSNPTRPTTFTLSQPCKITLIQNYHYFNNGAKPGTIALKHQDGTVYGPWQATGKEGMNKVANAYWVAKPDIVIKAGTYTVIDSDPTTWSQNAKSNGCGFTDLMGIKQQQ